MLRKIGTTLLCVGSLVSSCAFASTHVLVKGMSMNLELPANDPQVFTNFLMWSISAKCLINDADESNDIQVAALSKKGVVNGFTIETGQRIVLTVRPGDELAITANAGARVELTNQGSKQVSARCST